MATRADDVFMATRNPPGMPSGNATDPASTAGMSPRSESNRAIDRLDPEDADVSVQQKTGLPGLLEQPVVRKVAPYAAAALVLALGTVVYATLSQPVERPLYPNMADADKEAALTALTNGGIEAHLDTSTERWSSIRISSMKLESYSPRKASRRPRPPVSPRCSNPCP